MKRLVILLLMTVLFLVGCKSNSEPIQWEYKIEFIKDISFSTQMNSIGEKRWELVFARRAKGEIDFGYEVIFKRPKLKNGAKEPTDVSKLKGELDITKQTRTLGDIKSIATSIEMYRTVVRKLPNFSGTVEEMYKSIPDLAEIAGALRVTKDGWDNDYYIISDGGATSGSYSIGSGGKDGIFKGWKQSGKYSGTDFNQDIIYSNGTFTYCPE